MTNFPQTTDLLAPYGSLQHVTLAAKVGEPTKISNNGQTPVLRPAGPPAAPAASAAACV